MKSILYRGVDKNKSFRFILIDSTNIVEAMRIVHNTSTTATAALGRLTTMAAIMGMDLKSDKDSLSLKIKGDGKAGLLIGESDNKGNVRSYMDNPQGDIPSRSDGKLDVGGFVGHVGSLGIIRDYGIGEPYIGQTALVSGEIAEDFANYFYQSDQVPTVVSLGVLVDVDYSCKSAGGLFIQALPDYTDEDIDKLEKALNNLPPISSIFVDSKDPTEIFSKYFGEFEIEILGEREVQYKCRCSRSKISEAILSIGKDELEKIIREDHGAQLTCHFCNTVYDFTEDELVELLHDSRDGKSQ